MRPFERLAHAVGILGLAAFLALASPGVRSVRAEPTAAAQCDLSKPLGQEDADLERFLAELRRDYGTRARAGNPDRPEVVVLNGRGYNYGPTPGLTLDEIRAELRQRRP